jgi:3-oxoacyl-[acyl-carrier-protein] synthase II
MRTREQGDSMAEGEAHGAIEGANPLTAVVGIGAVTGYGWGRKHLQQGLLSGRSAVRAVPGFFPAFARDIQWVARVPDEGGEDDGAGRGARAAHFAVREAVDNAHDRGWRAGSVVGIVHCVVPEQRGLMSDGVVAEVMQEFGFHGPAVGVTAMTASTIAGLLTAKTWIEGGTVDDVIVVTGDLSVSPERCAALRDLGILQLDGPALDRCRPFQEGSRGTPAGEATVAFVVSNHADQPYATIRGGAMNYEVSHTEPLAFDLGQVRRAFTEALDRSGVAAADVAYLNAHGSGIPGCDAVEAAVFDQLLPAGAGLFSVKPLVGHCQAAAGAVELCASLYGFETGVIPAPPRVAAGHRRLLDGPTAAVDGLVVKASLGMSGHNAVVVLAPAG